MGEAIIKKHKVFITGISAARKSAAAIETTRYGVKTHNGKVLSLSITVHLLKS